MHPADITAALRKSRSSQAQIARQLDTTKANVSQVVAGKYKSHRVQVAISRATRIPLTTLWPHARRNGS